MRTRTIMFLVLILTLTVASASFGVVKSAVKVSKTQVVSAPAPVTAPSSGITVSPKLIMATGDYSGLAIGVESYFYNVPGVDGLQLGAEGNYKLASNNISWIQIGGIGRYMIPMEGQIFMPYVGGGLNYNMYSINMTGAGSASGIGFKIFGGVDYPVAGVGTFFGNVGYANQSFNYSVSVFGFTQSVSASGGGLYIEGGDRFSF